MDAPVQTLAQRLREIPAGESRWFTDPPASVKSTLTRLKKQADGIYDFDYHVRTEGGGLRVWRLA